MTTLRAQRNAPRISQNRLARLSGVSRFKICTYEVGDGVLTSTEQTKIGEALRAEADRLRNFPTRIVCGEPLSPSMEDTDG